jgi:hypothetical protein
MLIVVTKNKKVKILILIRACPRLPCLVLP